MGGQFQVQDYKRSIIIFSNGTKHMLNAYRLAVVRFVQRYPIKVLHVMALGLFAIY